MNDPKKAEQQIIAVPSDEKASVEIVPFGTDERIRLSIAIVQKMIAVPTRTGKLPDDNQCMKFIMLCKSRHLNPFEGDAYLLGYDTQSGPQFSLITAHQVFLKRAEASKGFDGMASGVIVQTAAGIEEHEGDLVTDSEKLIGGWAKVFRKDKTYPYYKRLKLATFNTGRSRWEKDPAGMICKCAEADALRTAFPTHLGGLYLQEENEPIDITPTIQRAKVPKLMKGNNEEKTVQAATETHEAAPVQEVEVDQSATATPARDASLAEKKTAPLRKKKTVPSSESPNRIEVLKRLHSEGCQVGDLVDLALENDWITAGETWPLSEERLAGFLEGDNWKTIMDGLKASK